MNLYIGALSGTSMDGIDVAIVNLQDNVILAADTMRYPSNLHQRILDLSQGKKRPATEIAIVNRLIGKAFAQACLSVCQTANLEPSHITAIGSHGQTICHDGFGKPSYTMQLGCAHTIAYETGITTVADFRSRNIVTGGQGAPLAPLYHKHLFAALPKPIAVINIGGVANISWLSNDTTYGYDTGPGNGLMDLWIQSCKALPYDNEGAWAATGVLIPSLLQQMLKDPYFHINKPKSLDKLYFSKSWLKQHLTSNMAAVDVQTTLSHFSAKSIANEVECGPEEINTVICCGGGARNRHLLECLSLYLPEIPIKTPESLSPSINGDYIEAMLFAWLAQQRLAKIPMCSKVIMGGERKGLMGVVYE